MLVPDVIRDAVMFGGTIALSISGGKDGQAMAIAVSRWLDDIGRSDQAFALHMDLGRMEWPETEAHVVKIAESVGKELVVVRRPQGDLLQEIEDRMAKVGAGVPFWPSSAARYCTADQKRSQADKVLRKPFWPSSANRYCTSHHKSNQADKEYRKHYLIISAEGNRAAESKKRSLDKPVSIRKAITSKALVDMDVEDALKAFIEINRIIDKGLPMPDGWKRFKENRRPRLALTWYPIHDWSLDDVWAACGVTQAGLDHRREVYGRAWDKTSNPWKLIDQKMIDEALDGWPLHPAYVYGNERVSCAMCVLATKSDLANGARHNPELHRHLISLEEIGNSTFKHGWSLKELVY